MTVPTPPSPKRFSPAKQRRMDELLEKNSEGTITPAERVKLGQLVDEAERLMVSNAKRLAKFGASDAGKGPSPSVPLTVWVTTEPTSR
jgi:hypothetical protein